MRMMALLPKFHVPFKGRFDWFGSIVALIGLAFIVGSVWQAVLVESFLDRAEPATATVLDVHNWMTPYGSDDHGLIQHKPPFLRSAGVTIEYRDSEGVIRRAYSEQGGETTSLRAGDSVEILYDPNNPSIVRGAPRAGYRLHSWLWVAVLFFLGAFFIRTAVKEYLESQPSPGRACRHVRQRGCEPHPAARRIAPLPR